MKQISVAVLFPTDKDEWDGYKAYLSAKAEWPLSFLGYALPFRKNPHSQWQTQWQDHCFVFEAVPCRPRPYDLPANWRFNAIIPVGISPVEALELLNRDGEEGLFQARIPVEELPEPLVSAIGGLL